VEPVTHVLTGACLARTGLNRRAAYATLAMAIAAEFPDIDTVWSLRGPVSGFEHHRGITHTFIGLPFEAAVLLVLLMLLHRVRSRRWRAATNSDRTGEAPTAAPVRWSVLYGLLLLALLSHLLLDFTNNYGIRPLFPFQPRWYAASIVFIVDPVILLCLITGLLLPSLFSLIAGEVGARRKPFQGAAWARTALVCIMALWILRTFEHSKAINLADSQILQAPATNPDRESQTSPPDTSESAIDIPDHPRPWLAAQRSLASPDPFSPFRWYVASDFGPAYRLGTADTRTGVISAGHILTKPSPNPAMSAAEQSRFGRIYLDWSPMPWLSDSDIGSVDPELPANAHELITFQDLRFMNTTPLLQSRNPSPLTGEVLLDAAGHVIAQGMDGRLGK
jgi:inner membrane protein